MAAPAGATHLVRPTVQAAQVAWSGSQEWPLDLLCICDMDLSINTGAQSFVAGLESDLSDLELTDAADSPIPWRRAEAGLFSQVAGSEKLWVRVRAALSGDANTEFRAYRGCSAPTGEDDGTGIVGATAVSAYPLQEASGNLLDLTAHNNDAARVGSVSQVTAKVGYGQSFGSGNYANVAASTGLPDGTAVTIVAWVKRATLLTWEHIWATGTDSNGGYGLRVHRDSSRIQLFARVGGSYNDAQFSTGRVPLATWTHVAAAVSGSTVYYYISGSPAGSQVLTGAPILSPGNTQSTLGALVFGGSPGTYWGDALDEILVVGETWSAAEVAAHYNMTSAPAAWCVCGAEEALGGVVPMIRSSRPRVATGRLIG